ncbi:spore germination lipoprotein GerD [Chengkuizengella axinellae]|uniref:Spore germination lipoprotein GerD n=1 Tax=Chengkuizengella axinellae TaxID=3064388 RepID=A0ABT9J5T5_9BACL|nr:spore germination lipoprotein GerD [Chengkuizengella sp. 2205SS18-9]MDP5276918.1 spore germination lipoprotein GerD [Chengkuizengella sp. 2205SS18-9]
MTLDKTGGITIAQMKKFLKVIPYILLITLATSCGSDESSGGNQTYKDTKSMVLDILSSEDGKKAITEALEKNEDNKGAPKMLQTMPKQQSEEIQGAVKLLFTDPSFPKYFEDMMKKDPKFAGEFAKTIQEQNKDIHKELLKDPEYQTQLLEVMKDPEYKDLVFEVMKGKDYRGQTMAIMQDAFKSPLFRVELMDLLKKVLEEESKPKEEKSSEEKGSENASEEG